MILTRIRLRNFRQHANLTLTPGAGLTAIVGPNGRGKSTVFEAVVWALYGAKAARGTNDTLPRRGAAKSECEVEVEFRLGELAYRVARTLGSAAVYVGDGPPVASGADASAKYLAERLGLTRDEFLNTYFTGQKELEFLSREGPAEKSRFLSRLLGYDRFRAAQELVRADRKTARTRHDTLAGRLEEVAPASDEDLAAARASVGANDQVVQAAHDEERLVQDVRAELAEQHDRAKALGERDRGLAEQVRDLEEAERRDAAALARAREAVETARAAEGEAARVRGELDGMGIPAAREELERLRADQTRVAERRTLEAELARLAGTAGEISGVEQRLTSAEALAAELPAIAEALSTREAEIRAEVEGATAEMGRVKEEGSRVAERIRTSEAAREELDAEIARLRELGEDADCPTCTRPLGAVFGQVLRAADERRARLSAELDALQGEREALLRQHEAAARRRRAAQQAEQGMGEERTRGERARRAAEALPELRARRAELEGRRDALQVQIAELPERVDAGRIRALEELIERAHRLAERLEQAELAAGKRSEAEHTSTTLQAAIERRRIALADFQAERASVGFDPDIFAELEARLRGAEESLRAASMRRLEAINARDGAAAALRRLEEQHAARQRDEAALQEARAEVQLLDEVDRAYTELRHALNDSIRPDLSEIASALLVEITAGRFRRLEVDEEYRIRVWDDGDECPVISGGEADVANLALRLAVSELIARRSGRPLNFLMLDEVFGSLDRERQRRVMDVLTSLSERRFEQVLIITHSDGVQDVAHQVLDLGAPAEASAWAEPAEPGIPAEVGA